jgi:hypothetical protein
VKKSVKVNWDGLTQLASAVVALGGVFLGLGLTATNKGARGPAIVVVGGVLVFAGLVLLIKASVKPPPLPPKPPPPDSEPIKMPPVSEEKSADALDAYSSLNQPKAKTSEKTNENRTGTRSSSHPDSGEGGQA